MIMMMIVMITIIIITITKFSNLIGYQLDSAIRQYASCLCNNCIVRAITHARELLDFFVFIFKRAKTSQILLQLWLIGNRTSFCPILSVIMLVIQPCKNVPAAGDLASTSRPKYIRSHNVLFLVISLMKK